KEAQQLGDEGGVRMREGNTASQAARQQRAGDDLAQQVRLARTARAEQIADPRARLEQGSELKRAADRGWSGSTRRRQAGVPQLFQDLLRVFRAVTRVRLEHAVDQIGKARRHPGRNATE